MKVLTVRLDDDTHARIKASAERDARSLNGQINWLLKAGLLFAEKPPPDIDAYTAEVAEKIHKAKRVAMGYSKEQQAGRGKR